MMSANIPAGSTVGTMGLQKERKVGRRPVRDVRGMGEGEMGMDRIKIHCTHVRDCKE